MLKWTKWLSNGCKGDTRGLSHTTQDKLNETLDMLDRRKFALQEKVSIENERLKGFTRNKKASAECVKRKSFYESQLEQVENVRSQVTDQIKMLKGYR
ncbi:18S rRNA (guanine(1575)-N(7))-methyltransferase [Ranunculus cassubicifolius]